MDSLTVNAVLPPVEPQSGRGSLGVGVVSGLSTVTSNCSFSPLKLLVPQPRGTSVWAFTSSLGGGLVAGDQTCLDLRLGPGARCFVGTQASTKIYRNPSRLPCSHETQATLEPGSLLVLAPDPVQAFAESTYSQRQEFHLAENSAGLVLLDWFTSGRAAQGERWTFRRLQSRNDIFVNGKRRLMDSLLLDGSEGSLLSPHRAGRFNCLATLILAGELVKEVTEALLSEISGRTIERRASLVCSASVVAQGTILRMAGESVEDVTQELHGYLKLLSPLLGGDPWARKW